MSETGANIRSSLPEDRQAVRQVLTAAFGRRDEAELVDRLVSDVADFIELVALADGQVVGHVLLTPLVAPANCFALAPLSVLPEYQNRKIGSALVTACLHEAAEKKASGVFVLGEPAYYRRFGFSREAAAKFDSPYPSDYMMAYRTSPDGLSGCGETLIYPPAFGQE